MGPPPHEHGSVGAEEQGLADDVVAVALTVSIGHEGTRAHAVSQRGDAEQLPLLLRVQIADETREIPILEEGVALGMEEERRGALAIEGVTVLGAGLVERDATRVDLVVVAAEILSDVDVVAVLQSTASATTRSASTCWRPRIMVVIPDSFHSPMRSRIRSFGPHSEISSASSSGTAAMASPFLPSR